MNDSLQADIEADESVADVVKINEAILWSAMKDIYRQQGLDTLETMVDENIAILKCGAE